MGLKLNDTGQIAYLIDKKFHFETSLSKANNGDNIVNFYFKDAKKEDLSEYWNKGFASYKRSLDMTKQIIGTEKRNFIEGEKK